MVYNIHMKIKHITTGMFISQPFEQRFWEKVDKKDAKHCWQWKGYTNNFTDYGRLRIGKLHKVATHVSWFLHTGDWPKEYMCHKCDNKACVNPYHLFDGTHQDNMKDMTNKGRNYLGREKTSKLSKQIIKEIKQRLLTQKPRQIEKELAVNYWSIIKIKNNKQWKDVK